jgi:hypothetical protein
LARQEAGAAGARSRKANASCFAAFENARLLTIFKTDLLRIAAYLTQKLSKNM